jgi:bidirectional [NiFe] hydrogenase diaphorase subunit
MHRLLERINQGQAGRAELRRLEQLCDMVKHASLCGLGQSAPNPVLSTLRYFREEYLRRLVDNEAGESAEVAEGGNGRDWSGV